MAACAAAWIALGSAAGARAAPFDDLLAAPGPGRLGLLMDAVEMMKEHAAPAKRAGRTALVERGYRSDAKRLLTAFPANRRSPESARAWARLEQAYKAAESPSSSAAVRVEQFELGFELVAVEWDIESERLQRLVQLAERHHLDRRPDRAHGLAVEATLLLAEVHSAKRPLKQNRLLAPLLLSYVLFSTGKFQAAANQLQEALRYSPECLDIRVAVDYVCPAGDHGARLQALRSSADGDPAQTLLLAYQMTCGGQVPGARRLLEAAVRKWPDQLYLASFKDVLGDP